MKYKKTIYLVLLLIMYIPFIVNAESCDLSSIIIDSIELRNTSGSAEELSNPTVSGKKINLDLKFYEPGDSVEYNLKVKNTSNEDFYFDEESLKQNTDYLEYEFRYDDDLNIVKSNSTKNVNLRVEYKNEVLEDKFENRLYNDNKTMTIQLSNDEIINNLDTFTNPKTDVRAYLMIFMILILVSTTLYVVLLKKKYNVFMLIIIGSLSLIPTFVYAICRNEIKIESKIMIVKPLKKICRRATELNRIICSRNDNLGCAQANSYNYGEMITFGTLGTKGEQPVSGDAFDCDVTGTGKYERFYYLTKHDDVSVLIYYTNVKDGTILVGESAENMGTIPYYGPAMENFHGPITASEYLPSPEQWKNEQLIVQRDRTILTETGLNRTGGGLIEPFSYGGKAARLMTYSEAMDACGTQNVSSTGDNFIYNNNCMFLLDHLGMLYTPGGANGYWLETPLTSTCGSNCFMASLVFSTYATYKTISYNLANLSTDVGVRPVIEVLTTNIDY